MSSTEGAPIKKKAQFIEMTEEITRSISSFEVVNKEKVGVGKKKPGASAESDGEDLGGEEAAGGSSGGESDEEDPDLGRVVGLAKLTCVEEVEPPSALKQIRKGAYGTDSGEETAPCLDDEAANVRADETGTNSAYGRATDPVESDPAPLDPSEIEKRAAEDKKKETGNTASESAPNFGHFRDFSLSGDRISGPANNTSSSSSSSSAAFTDKKHSTGSSLGVGAVATSDEYNARWQGGLSEEQFEDYIGRPPVSSGYLSWEAIAASVFEHTYSKVYGREHSNATRKLPCSPVMLCGRPMWFHDVSALEDSLMMRAADPVVSMWMLMWCAIFVGRPLLSPSSNPASATTATHLKFMVADNILKVPERYNSCPEAPLLCKPKPIGNSSSVDAAGAKDSLPVFLVYDSVPISTSTSASTAASGTETDAKTHGKFRGWMYPLSFSGEQNWNLAKAPSRQSAFSNQDWDKKAVLTNCLGETNPLAFVRMKFVESHDQSDETKSDPATMWHTDAKLFRASGHMAVSEESKTCIVHIGAQRGEFVQIFAFNVEPDVFMFMREQAASELSSRSMDLKNFEHLSPFFFDKERDSILPQMKWAFRLRLGYAISNINCLKGMGFFETFHDAHKEFADVSFGQKRVRLSEILNELYVNVRDCGTGGISELDTERITRLFVWLMAASSDEPRENDKEVKMFERARNKLAGAENADVYEMYGMSGSSGQSSAAAAYSHPSVIPGTERPPSIGAAVPRKRKLADESQAGSSSEASVAPEVVAAQSTTTTTCEIAEAIQVRHVYPSRSKRRRLAQTDTQKASDK